VSSRVRPPSASLRCLANPHQPNPITSLQTQLGNKPSPAASQLTDRPETTPLLPRNQKPDTSGKIRSQVHHRPPSKKALRRSIEPGCAIWDIHMIREGHCRLRSKPALTEALQPVSSSIAMQNGRWVA
jgi:hypothetical protein